MQQALDFLIRHGYLVLFAAVGLEQFGLPVPAVPFLLGMGALAGDGRFNIWTALLCAVCASLPADWIWFELGRLRGYTVLRVVCRIAIEPDTCVKRTENIFLRYGSRAMVLSKFIPGFSTVAPPMAGLLLVPRWRFLLLDGAAAVLWSSVYLALGWIFRHQLEREAEIAAGMGAWFLVLAGAATVVYFGYKWIDRRRFLRAISGARIDAAELRRRMDSGEPVTVIDLRHTLEFERERAKVPGAIHLPPEQLPFRHQEIPRDRDIVLYCT